MQNIISEIEAGNAVLIDVRTKEEFDMEHALEALNWDVYNETKLPNISKDKKVYLYCRSGGRAERAKQTFLQSGFTIVENIGGLIHWKEAGGEVQADNQKIQY